MEKNKLIGGRSIFLRNFLKNKSLKLALQAGFKLRTIGDRLFLFENPRNLRKMSIFGVRFLYKFRKNYLQIKKIMLVFICAGKYQLEFGIFKLGYNAN